MSTEIYKILTNSTDYMCLSCGTYNCNDGICDRCGSVQYGSPVHNRQVIAKRKMDEELQLANKLGQEGYQQLLLNRENARLLDEQRLAENLVLREKWEQQKAVENAVQRAKVKQLFLWAFGAVVALVAITYIYTFTFAVLVVTGVLLGARQLIKTDVNVEPNETPPSYTRAPRSKE